MRPHHSPERITGIRLNDQFERLIIDPRYNGPNTSGNGGWVAGSLARLLGAGSVSVSLRAPAPLAVPMSVRWRDNGAVTLENDGTLIAEAGMALLELDVPKAPDREEAEAAGGTGPKGERASSKRALRSLFRVWCRARRWAAHCAGPSGE